MDVLELRDRKKSVSRREFGLEICKKTFNDIEPTKVVRSV